MSYIAGQLFRKKPVVVEALQWDGSLDSIGAICRWANNGPHGPIVTYLTTPTGVYDAQVDTLNGPVLLAPGEWVVRGVEGEFYPCKDTIFRATYEAIS